jgi:hypothetical protein
MGAESNVNQSRPVQHEIGRPRTHRVVVVSANTRPKSFAWKIVHEDRVSDRSFNSMESAYADGAAALTQYR